jgi:prepilin-type N-terminal cleavage/methylation domain-containing protein
MPAWKDRRRAQSGNTLIELLVSLVIVGLALVLIVGTFSTGLLDAALTKRNTAAQAVIQYELGEVNASQFNSTALSYSECFATESPTSPALLPSLADPCPSGSFSLRADVTVAPGPTPTSQLWTVTIVTWPTQLAVGSPLTTYKVNR